MTKSASGDLYRSLIKMDLTVAVMVVASTVSGIPFYVAAVVFNYVIYME